MIKLRLRRISFKQATTGGRHQDKRWDSHDLLRRGWLDVYQSFQARPVFDNLDFIISFIGVGGTQARFVGVYKVVARRPGSSGVLPVKDAA